MSWDSETAFSFTKFQDLPRELRIDIWELICPEFTTATQILEFRVQAMPNNAPYYTVYDTASLMDSTKKIRKVLAVHRESRAIVTQRLTGTLTFRASRDPSIEGLVRFNQGRDLIYLKDFAPLSSNGAITLVLYHLPDFAGCVQNVVVNRRSIDENDRRCATFLTNLIKLEKVFYCQTAVSNTPLYTLSWKWFTSSSCYQRRRWSGDETSIYCWPKLDTGLYIENMPRDVAHCARILNDYAQTHGWKLLPMVVFKGEYGMEDYSKLVTKELDHGAKLDSFIDKSASSYGRGSSLTSALPLSSTEVKGRQRREMLLRQWQEKQESEPQRAEARRAERLAAWAERYKRIEEGN